MKEREIERVSVAQHTRKLINFIVQCGSQRAIQYFKRNLFKDKSFYLDMFAKKHMYDDSIKRYASTNTTGTRVVYDSDGSESKDLIKKAFICLQMSRSSGWRSFSLHVNVPDQPINVLGPWKDTMHIIFDIGLLPFTTVGTVTLRLGHTCSSSAFLFYQLQYDLYI